MLFRVLISHTSVSILKFCSQFISSATIKAHSKPCVRLSRAKGEQFIIWNIVDDGKYPSFRWEFHVLRVAQTNISPLDKILGSVPCITFDFRSICNYSGTYFYNGKWIHSLDVLQVSSKSKSNLFWMQRNSGKGLHLVWI